MLQPSVFCSKWRERTWLFRRGPACLCRRPVQEANAVCKYSNLLWEASMKHLDRQVQTWCPGLLKMARSLRLAASHDSIQWHVNKLIKNWKKIIDGFEQTSPRWCDYELGTGLCVCVCCVCSWGWEEIDEYLEHRKKWSCESTKTRISSLQDSAKPTQYSHIQSVPSGRADSKGKWRGCLPTSIKHRNMILQRLLYRTVIQAAVCLALEISLQSIALALIFPMHCIPVKHTHTCIDE